MPRLLDLFCGAGGAAMGYHRAGFDEILGVDIKPQPRYPFTFVQGDALEYVKTHGHEFDAIHASPPCQAHTALRKMWNARQHADMIPETRDAVRSIGAHYVIENVPGSSTLQPVVKLCGTMFDLKTPNGAELRRHRYFEMSFLLLEPTCRHGWTVIGVYGDHVRDRCRTVGVYGEGCRGASSDPRRLRVVTVTGHTPQQNVEPNRVRQTYSVDDARVAMGMPWATIAELSQAIPPAYTAFIGKQLLAVLV